MEVSSSPLIVETRKNLKLKSWNKTIHRGFFNGAWRDVKEIISLFTTLKHQVKFANKRVKEDIKKMKIFDRHLKSILISNRSNEPVTLIRHAPS